MQIKPGLRLRSTACSTEAIVVKAPAGDIDLCCGGLPMVAHGEPASAAAAIPPEFRTGSLIGKRYVNDGEDVEILVTKGGEGGLSIGAAAMTEKAAKKLPSSD